MPRVVAGDQSWEFVEEDLTNLELIAIEKATDLTSVEFFQKINRGSFIALTALVWTLRRRTEPGLAFEAVTFPAHTLDLETSDVEGKSPADGTEPS